MSVPFLEQTLRWFGPDDPVQLSHIRQAGASGVVTAMHHIPCGEVWSIDEINRRRKLIESAGLRWSVVESVPVQEQIKRSTKESGRYLDNYCQSLRNLAASGIKIVCYNFMPATDWIRTDVNHVRPDGSEVSRLDLLDAAAFDLVELKRSKAQGDYTSDVISKALQQWAGYTSQRREQISRCILMGLPGTVEDLSVDQFRDCLRIYSDLGPAGLRSGLERFLNKVIPVAQEFGMQLAIHPDDPPFSIFGLPRIAGSEDDLRLITRIIDTPANGITFCTGSLGALATNDLPGMLRRLGDRVHFLHLRSVQIVANGGFAEDDHLAGSSSMTAIMREAVDLMARRNISLPMRPDHGARMLGDLQESRFYPGYSAIGRLRGLAELRGLELGIRDNRV
jgi:mannonate dehydratase